MHIEFARRSFRIAAAFGLASAACVIVLGDESGYAVTASQQSKLAAMEAMWESEPAPAGLTLLASINEAEQANDWEIKVPYMLGLIATRSASTGLPGIREIRAHNRERIKSGIEAVAALEAMRRDPHDSAARELFKAHQQDMGYGLLLRRYTENVRAATPDMIERAVMDSVPRVAPLFWSFRLMVGLGFSFLALFALAFWFAVKNEFRDKTWLLKWALWGMPLPWIASQLGWFVAEYGRQPWTVFGLLPTHISASSLSAANIWGSIAAFVGFYTLLLVAELYLMFKYARLGPTVMQGYAPAAGRSGAPA